MPSRLLAQWEFAGRELREGCEVGQVGLEVPVRCSLAGAVGSGCERGEWRGRLPTNLACVYSPVSLFDKHILSIYYVLGLGIRWQTQSSVLTGF